MDNKRKSRPHNILYIFLVLGQCFALFPLKGIKGNNYSTLKFSWLLKRTFYSMFKIAIVFTNACFFIVKLCDTTEFLTNFVSLVYFTTIFVVYILFIDLAKKWPMLMKKWDEVDRAMAKYSYPYNLDRKLKHIAVYVLISACVEHALFVVSQVNGIQANTTSWEKTNIFFRANFEHVFNIIPYNIYLGIYLQVLNIYCTFVWNYKDLLIMLLSIIISFRFTQIAKELQSMLQQKISDKHKWRTAREDYVRLVLLCKLVDKSLSNIVILSFVHNLFLILIQCLHTLYSTNSSEKSIYFIYSFGFIIIRTIMICMYAGTIDGESRRPLDILNSLPSEMYNIEIERFITQVKVAPSCLSGRQFFHITPSLVLRIAGAIVTYELVLIQMYNA